MAVDSRRRRARWLQRLFTASVARPPRALGTTMRTATATARARVTKKKKHTRRAPSEAAVAYVINIERRARAA